MPAGVRARGSQATDTGGLSITGGRSVLELEVRRPGLALDVGRAIRVIRDARRGLLLARLGGGRIGPRADAQGPRLPSCHCEERRDEAISAASAPGRDCFVALRTPRNDG